MNALTWDIQSLRFVNAVEPAVLPLIAFTKIRFSSLHALLSFLTAARRPGAHLKTKDEQKALLRSDP